MRLTNILIGPVLAVIIVNTIFFKLTKIRTQSCITHTQ